MVLLRKACRAVRSTNSALHAHVIHSFIHDTLSHAHVQENIGAFDIDLSEECIEDIERVYKRFRDPTTKPIDD